MGCAVVSMKDIRVRQAIISASNEVNIGGIKVQMKRHTDKVTGDEVLTDLFVAWGRQVEKTSPLSEHELTKFFDSKHREITEAWRNEEQNTLRQQEEHVVRTRRKSSASTARTTRGARQWRTMARTSQCESTVPWVVPWSR
mmetsp:Transcript_83383/g.212309  ORF Transcript_83383/g.212309 Transcript_83383/m.212309 type:complete len:141 (-) Transcript_83383:200-622(-)